MWENDWLEYLYIAVRVWPCICASVPRCGSDYKYVPSSHTCTVCMRVCCLLSFSVCVCDNRCKAENADAFSRSCPLPPSAPPILIHRPLPFPCCPASFRTASTRVNNPSCLIRETISSLSRSHTRRDSGRACSKRVKDSGVA
jgi:hypothetical protein